jgi:OOP family OmpA-OmpF porin
VQTCSRPPWWRLSLRRPSRRHRPWCRRRRRWAPTACSASNRSAEGDLLPDGRQRVERLAAALRGQTFDRVVVVGHTDRLGSDAYNDALSLSRAQTVRQLLVQNRR